MPGALGALPGTQQPDNRSAANPELLGDGPLTDPVLAKLFHFRHEFTRGHWPPMWSPLLSGLIDSRLHPVPQNIPFEFRKHGQHACESATARGGEIERFAQRNEAHVERRQFLKRVNKIYERPSPAIKPPDDD